MMAPGRLNPNNALLPFGQFETVHVARFVILKDNSPDDVRIFGLPRRDYPLYLAFLGNVDGDADAFWRMWRGGHRLDCVLFFRVAKGSPLKPIWWIG